MMLRFVRCHAWLWLAIQLLRNSRMRSNCLGHIQGLPWSCMWHKVFFPNVFFFQKSKQKSDHNGRMVVSLLNWYRTRTMILFFRWLPFSLILFDLCGYPAELHFQSPVRTGFAPSMKGLKLVRVCSSWPRHHSVSRTLACNFMLSVANVFAIGSHQGDSRCLNTFIMHFLKPRQAVADWNFTAKKKNTTTRCTPNKPLQTSKQR